MSKTNAEVVYSRMMGVVGEYDEMVVMLKQIKQAAEAASAGAKVDWASVAKQIDNLRAFQAEK